MQGMRMPAIAAGEVLLCATTTPFVRSPSSTDRLRRDGTSSQGCRSHSHAGSRFSELTNTHERGITIRRHLIRAKPWWRELILAWGLENCSTFNRNGYWQPHCNPNLICITKTVNEF